MLLYRNTKVKVRSPDRDTDYFDILTSVLQGDTLTSYLFIIYLDYVLRTSIDKIKENGNNNNSINYQSFVDLQLNDQTVLFQTIQFSISTKLNSSKYCYVSTSV